MGSKIGWNWLFSVSNNDDMLTFFILVVLYENPTWLLVNGFVIYSVVWNSGLDRVRYLEASSVSSPHYVGDGAQLVTSACRIGTWKSSDPRSCDWMVTAKLLDVFSTLWMSIQEDSRILRRTVGQVWRMIDDRWNLGVFEFLLMTVNAVQVNTKYWVSCVELLHVESATPPSKKKEWWSGQLSSCINAQFSRC